MYINICKFSSSDWLGWESWLIVGQKLPSCTHDHLSLCHGPISCTLLKNVIFWLLYILYQCILYVSTRINEKRIPVKWEKLILILFLWFVVFEEQKGKLLAAKKQQKNPFFKEALKKKCIFLGGREGWGEYCFHQSWFKHPTWRTTNCSWSPLNLITVWKSFKKYFLDKNFFFWYPDWTFYFFQTPLVFLSVTQQYFWLFPNFGLVAFESLRTNILSLVLGGHSYSRFHV